MEKTISWWIYWSASVIQQFSLQIVQISSNWRIIEAYLGRETLAVTTPGSIEIDEDAIEGGYGGVEVRFIQLQHRPIHREWLCRRKQHGIQEQKGNQENRECCKILHIWSKCRSQGFLSSQRSFFLLSLWIDNCFLVYIWLRINLRLREAVLQLWMDSQVWSFSATTHLSSESEISKVNKSKRVK